MSLLNEVKDLLKEEENFGEVYISSETITYNPKISSQDYKAEYSDELDRKMWDIEDTDLRRSTIKGVGVKKRELAKKANSNLDKYARIYIELVKSELTNLANNVDKIKDTIK